jgi:hypothetical protein
MKIACYWYIWLIKKITHSSDTSVYTPIKIIKLVRYDSMNGDWFCNFYQLLFFLFENFQIAQQQLNG